MAALASSTKVTVKPRDKGEVQALREQGKHVRELKLVSAQERQRDTGHVLTALLRWAYRTFDAAAEWRDVSVNACGEALFAPQAPLHVMFEGENLPHTDTVLQSLAEQHTPQQVHAMSELQLRAALCKAHKSFSKFCAAYPKVSELHLRRQHNAAVRREVAAQRAILLTFARDVAAAEDAAAARYLREHGAPMTLQQLSAVNIEDASKRFHASILKYARTLDAAVKKGSEGNTADDARVQRDDAAAHTSAASAAVEQRASAALHSVLHPATPQGSSDGQEYHYEDGAQGAAVDDGFDAAVQTVRVDPKAVAAALPKRPVHTAAAL